MYFNPYIFRKQTVKQKNLDRIVVGITEVLSALNFLMKCNFEKACLVEFVKGLDHFTASTLKLRIELLSDRGSKYKTQRCHDIEDLLNIHRQGKRQVFKLIIQKFSFQFITQKHQLNLYKYS